MKRFIAIIIALMLTLSSVTIVNASDIPKDLSEIKTKTFDDENYKRLSEEDVFYSKLDEIGLSSSYQSLLYRKMFSEICNAKTISTITSYYVESNEDILQTTKETYEETVIKEKNNIILKEKKSKEQASQRGSQNIILSPGATDEINQGTLNIVILLVSSNNIDFTCAAMFQWETMPSARHNDAFGLSRDGSTTSVVAQSACGAYDIYCRTSYLSGTDYVTYDYVESNEVGFADLKSSPDGYAYEFQLPPDSTQSNYPYANSTITFYEAAGVLMYDGNINNNNILSVNHWATYGHKRFSILVDSIDFSIPFSAGFSIKFLGYYNQLTEEHTWRIK